MPSVPTVRASADRGVLLRAFGFELSRVKAAVSPVGATAADREAFGLTGTGGSWVSVVRESFTGAWQRNIELRRETVLTYHAVYACVTLIASDVSKCRLRLVEQDADGIWSEVDTPAFSPVLRKPNRYQNRIKFYEQWIVSKLLHGNTYVLLERDLRGVVVAMYVLDPCRTKPLVAPDGSIFYQLSRDNLADVPEPTVIPASEIIHDVMVPLYHPLCGVSPISSCGLAAAQGLAIQRNSALFFQSGSKPGGVLTAPGRISDQNAKEIKEYWEKNFTGENVGKVAVLGDGMKYEHMSVNATDAQLIEQLKWSGEVVCSAFKVPGYKIGVGTPPAYNNIEALDQQYYAQCLQTLFENIELCLDEGLGLPDVKGHTYGTEFDLDDLLRMDTATLVESEKVATGAGIKKLDEARKRLNLPPMKGGDAAYLQQQNFSVEALSKRDSQPDPFAAKNPTAPPAPPPSARDIDDLDSAALGQLGAWELKAQLDRLQIAA